MDAIAKPRAARILPWLVVGWVFLACLFPLADYDIWWHLKTGELIWRRGELPRTDWYTYTDHARPWIDLHWGFQLVVAALYHAGGASAIVVVKAACLAVAVAIGWRVTTAGDLPAWTRSLVWAPAVVAIYGRGYERPEVVSLVLLAVWLRVVFRADQTPRRLWLLPLVQVVWVNFHVLFVLGLVVGGSLVVDTIVRRLARGRFGCVPPSPALDVRLLAATGTLAILAALVNPYGLDGAMFPEVVYRKFTVEQDFYASRIGEFQKPFDFIRQHGLVSVTLGAELLVAIVAAISFLALAWRGRWSPLRLLLFLGFGHLAWEAARNTNIFCLVAAAVTVENFAQWRKLRHAAVADEIPNGDASSATSSATSSAPSHMSTHATHDLTKGGASSSTSGILGDRLAVAAWLVAMLLVVTGGWGRMTGGAKSFGLGQRADWFAHAAARFAGRSGFPKTAVVAHFGQSAVFTYHNGPDRKVFVDGRLEVCSQATVARHERILEQMVRGDRQWEEEHLAEFGELPLVLLDRRDARPQIEALVSSGTWRLIYADRTAALFLELDLAKRLGVPADNPSVLGLTGPIVRPTIRPDRK